MVPSENINDVSSITGGGSRTSEKIRIQKKYLRKCSKSETTGKKKSRCQELFGAITIYVLCISLPSLFGILVRWYEYHFVLDMDIPGSTRSYTEPPNLSTKQSGPSYYYTSPWREGDSSISSAFPPRRGVHARALFGSFSDSNSTAHHLGALISAVYRFLQRHIRLYIKRDALSDVQIVLVISTLLSIIRVLLVHMLVPRYLAPRRLAALFHAKSTHLLSTSEYEFSKRIGSKQCHVENNNNNNDDDDIDGPGKKSNMRLLLRDLWAETGQSFQRSLGHEAQSPLCENIDTLQATKFFVAPRYATAVFRLLFCLLSCSWALAKFSSSDFWPVWVGGRLDARTKYCWDLSGSVAFQGASLDSDFDHRNSALRYFFLGQASYQIHSLGFHFLSMGLLLICGRRNDGYLSARTSLKSYFRPIMEHSCYFVLTVMTYIFSGLRRLGAICIFVLEFSSMVLQLLQICINAPEKSIWKNAKLARLVHRYLAIPVFIYCRFFVMPFIVQYSALFESGMWLKQIEHALAPGVGMIIYLFFNGMLLLAFGLNFVYLRRLLFHPSLEQSSREKLLVLHAMESKVE